MSDEEKEMMHFIARRLGWKHFIIAGYDPDEFRAHVLSQGELDIGHPVIGINTHLTGAAYIVACILTQFEFSPELRRAVHSIVNTILTGREIKQNAAERQEDC